MPQATPSTASRERHPDRRLGNDTYVVDSTDDEVEEEGGAGTDLIRSSVTYELPTRSRI